MTKKQGYAYAAGIIDGEGCIGVYSFGGKNLYPSLNVTSTDKELVDWLVNLFGRGTLSHCKPGKRNKRAFWCWDCVGNAALDVLTLVEPFLVIERKRQKVVLLLEQWPRHAEGNGGLRIPNSPELIETRRSIKAQFAEIGREQVAAV